MRFHLFHQSLVCAFGLAENFCLLLKPLTMASTSSMGDLTLCLVFVIFVAKLSKPVHTNIFGKVECVNKMIQSMQS
jgi:hypothetical protein